MLMSRESRFPAGLLLIILPTAMIGGMSLLTFLITPGSGYMENPLRQNLWRAGHAHAGVFLLLALLLLRYVDEAELSPGTKRAVRVAAPLAAILVPVAFFLSMVSPEATHPNALVYLAYAGGGVLALGVLVLGVGLLRAARQA